ncbi:hypothetical protein N0V93_010209 [Gnomoniopsis smithogilvyi]|uniref:Uncharacterized protein n=1 Tax=Gnomoniopsis smithogilvyi TaxID=1191159 RepID=A0A9W9CS43_9PEZI|nr:hypothetical protein N0V93_010209 [Gnomoniopsis smithogilvyi]
MACPPIAKLQSLGLRLKSAVTRRRYGESELKRRSIKISDPFNFQHIMQGSPNGMNEDEVNVLLGKTAATRMIPIEDQPRPPSSSSNSFFNSGSQTAFGPSATTSASQIRPKTPMKTRAGYRGLASSSAANGGRGLAYCPPMAATESHPSITHTFAAADDTNDSDSTAGSFVTASSMSTLPTRHEQRGKSI